MNIPLFILIITSAVNVGVLLMVLSRKTSETNILSVRIFTSSIVSLLAWSTFNYLADHASMLSDALFWTKATFPAALLMGLSIVFFSITFPVKSENYQKTISLYAFLVVIFSIASMGDSIIKSVTLVESVGISQVEVGYLYPAIVFMYLTFIGHSTYNFVKSHRSLQGRQKSQVTCVLIGWTTFLSIAVMTNAVLPLITGNANWSKFGPLGSVLMVIFISYAIIRHQFLDIKIIIQKGLIYSVLLSVITGTYLSLVFSFEYFFNKSSEVSIFISALITTLAGIFGVPPLKAFFQRSTDTFFFKDTYNYAEVLHALTNALNKNIALDTIVEKTSEILRQSLKSETVVFSFKGEKGVEESGVMHVPIKSNKKNIGYLILGEKRSGDQYTKEDMSLLGTFAQQAGTALEKASLYKQVKEYAKVLEKKVEERTAEITAIQKGQETLMLEISHGLQTPLTIMKGELFFLRKQGYDTGRVDTIDTSIDRISSFINRFLSLSRLETAVVDEKVNLNLSLLLQKVVSFFEQETQSKNITLTSNISDDVYVEGNREELEELFSNLVSNSIKYMSKEGARKINVSLVGDGATARITLKDTGIGIRREHLPNLFKKFYRVKESETKGIQGTGLGLVICKKIIDMHKGTIEVTSTFGEGTTFTITFPKSGAI